MRYQRFIFLVETPTDALCCCRLIDEVLGKDAGDKVPIEKVVMIIWQFRDDPQVVKFMTRFVAKVGSVTRLFSVVSIYVVCILSSLFSLLLYYCSFLDLSTSLMESSFISLSWHT